ncbi:hypothetical protein HDV62DRAFT_382087 [Trichoderma sp. SZMC 28011]
MAGCFTPLQNSTTQHCKQATKESQTCSPPATFSLPFTLSRASLFSRRRTRRANHTVAAQPPRTRHDKPLRAQGIFAFHTSGQKGNDPCAIARGSPGEPGRVEELGSLALVDPFFWLARLQRFGRGDDDDGEVTSTGPHNHCRTSFFSCRLFIEIGSTLLLARITHTGVITSQN